MGHERKGTAKPKPRTSMDCSGEVGVLLAVHSLYACQCEGFKGRDTAGGSVIDECLVVMQSTEPIPF